eukprot:TRINITY_DN982_c0_g1_i1.p1 TRINITY_DN982_c0_g1~~TRINITY_DN982_c0_g1_i1.p1  ORF type:complete len:452 (+),score=70.89 TRINITY_DN982_c0_g1_i1:32-1357(+)
MNFSIISTCRQSFSHLEQVQKLGAARRFCSTNAGTENGAEAPPPPPPLHRTNESLVRNHTTSLKGKFFTVDPKIVNLFGPEMYPRKYVTRTRNYFAPTSWSDRNKCLGESCLMIREPALDILNCLKQTNFEAPAVRYVLHGRHGYGKSLTLSHLMCYGHQENFIIMPFLHIDAWSKKYYEIAPSTFKPGRIDHITNANIFLKHFRQANSNKLSKCVTHRDYSWSARDKISAGSNLSEVVELGCDRLNFASDALNVLIRELKLNCKAGNCKMMVLVDGVNTLFQDSTLVNKETTTYKHGPYDEQYTSKFAKVEECSNFVGILKLLKNDYKNAAIITTVRTENIIGWHDPSYKSYKTRAKDTRPDTTSHLPFALLGEKGWSVMNPFYPVTVDKFSRDEMDSHLDYYIEKGWIRPECDQFNRREELHFVTGRIPKDLFEFSAMY